ncbi:MAG: hypothetical protein LBD45_06925, partial [Bacteroidales bacterium]|nr:hypothetical protein [Bacteroidales bacterium]
MKKILYYLIIAGAFMLNVTMAQGQTPPSAGGGTPVGTGTFTPVAGKYYMIINYANNSGGSANYSGAPKYMTFNAD